MTLLSFHFLFPGVLSMLMAVAFLLFKKQASHGQWILVLCQFFVGLSSVLYSAFFHEGVGAEYLIGVLYLFVVGLVPSLFVLGISMLVSDVEKISQIRRMFIIPAVWILITSIAVILAGMKRCRYFCETFFVEDSMRLIGDWRADFLMIAGGWLFYMVFGLMSIYAFIKSIPLIKRYSILISESYTSSQDSSYQIVRQYYVAYVLVAAVIVVEALAPIELIKSELLIIMSCLLLSLAYTIMGVFVFTINSSADELAVMIEDNEILHQNELSEDKRDQAIEELYVRIRQAMRVEQVYLNPEINLLWMAEHLNTSVSMVQSAYERHNPERSFSLYVNTFRIEHAIGLFRKEIAELTINENDSDEVRVFGEWAALYSGFKTYNAFCDAFKDVKNVSFKKWIAAGSFK